MIYYYRYSNKLLFSKYKIKKLVTIKNDDPVVHQKKFLYYLDRQEWGKVSPKSVLIHPGQLKGQEDISILKNTYGDNDDFDCLPGWIKKKIKDREIGFINYNHPGWKKILKWEKPARWKVNIIGLGNVGGTLLTALRLIGSEKITEIGIFDTNEQALSRWEQEVNQIVDSSSKIDMPNVKIIKENKIFEADMVIFCISIGVPPPGQKIKDVRMMQFTANSGIINIYAQQARKLGYNGIFAVVSDPVDLLCQSAFLTSNRNEKGILDGEGLSPDQIRGFGLGVMHGRAVYYANKNKKTRLYLEKGRVFGPHGKGLVIADNMEDYNHQQSIVLSKKVLQANIAIRRTGFKPYIAPALSSGALSVLALISGDWHYSAAFLGGIFWGAKNRQTSLGLEWEQNSISTDLFERINNSYQYLKKLAQNLEK